MRTCPYCRGEVHEEAVKCRHCGSSLAEQESLPAGKYTTYIIDRDLVRYLKVAVSVLAIFIVVGAFLYGFDLKQASKEIRNVQESTKNDRDDIVRIKSEIVELKSDVVAVKAEASTLIDGVKKQFAFERAKLETLERELADVSVKAKSYHTEILEHRDRVRLEIATIDVPVDESKAELIFQQLLMEHLFPVLSDEQIAQVKTRFKSMSPSLSGLVDQPALSLIRVEEAQATIENPATISIAILSDDASSPVPEVQARFYKGWSVFPSNGTSTDSHMIHHTTAVASLIAAVARSARIIPIQVFSGSSDNTLSDTIEGIRYALNAGAEIIVAPFGSTTGKILYEQISRVVEEKNVLFIAAAGNDASKTPMYPAAISSSVAVVSTDLDDVLAPFSSYGPWVDFAAPGVDITTLNAQRRFSRLSGSSFSTAIVAAVAALVLSENPSLNAREVLQILRQSAVNIGPKNTKYAGNIGAGRVDALRAVQLAKMQAEP